MLAYMIAFHNVYQGDQKMVNDIAISVEVEDQADDAAPLF
jgi:hypothetical protein